MEYGNSKKYKPYALVDIVEISAYLFITSLLLVLSVIFYTRTEDYKNKSIITESLSETKTASNNITEKNELYHSISFFKIKKGYYPGSETNIDFHRNTYQKEQKSKKLKEKNKRINAKKNKSSKYTVKKGDTLMKIASNFNVSFIDIAILNSIENTNLISKGRVIDIPNYFYL